MILKSLKSLRPASQNEKLYPNRVPRDHGLLQIYFLYYEIGKYTLVIVKCRYIFTFIFVQNWDSSYIQRKSHIIKNFQKYF